MIYVLDEPSMGLHQRDNRRLLDTLEHLRDLGNSVIVVEHDLETIRPADHIVDFGPAAGIHGGQVVAQGTPAEVAATLSGGEAQRVKLSRELAKRGGTRPGPARGPGPGQGRGGRSTSSTSPRRASTSTT